MNRHDVHKASHCAWQIHYHVVFPVKYRRKPELKRALWGGEFWSDGCYVATVDERGDLSVVERYVRNQGNPKDDLRQFKLF